MTKQEREQVDPKCPACHGKGEIGYQFDQDTCRIAYCYRCFPDDENAQRWRKHWESGANVV